MYCKLNKVIFDSLSCINSSDFITYDLQAKTFKHQWTFAVIGEGYDYCL